MSLAFEQTDAISETGTQTVKDANQKTTEDAVGDTLPALPEILPDQNQFITEDADGNIFYRDKNGNQASGLCKIMINDSEAVYWYFDRQKNNARYSGQKYFGTEKATIYGYDGSVLETEKINSGWRYFDEKNGNMAVGTTKIPAVYNDGKEKWVYYNEDGSMYYGQKKVNGSWRYFQKTTGEMAVGLTKVPAEYNAGKDNWIYFNSDGSKFRETAFPYTDHVSIVYQNPELPTGCESVALTMVLKSMGYSLEKTTLAKYYMPISANDFVSCFWGDPFSEYGGGAYVPAMMKTADAFLKKQGSDERARDVSGSSFKSLYNYIDQGYPVMVWSTMYMKAPLWRDIYRTYNGKTYRWYSMEHCVVLCDYNRANHTVLIADPLSGMVWRNASDFENIYNETGRMAMIVK